MEPFGYHVYACQQEKPEGVVSCTVRGSLRMIDALRNEIKRRGLIDKVQLTLCGSLGMCERGPNMVVYPEGVWYSGVAPEDVPEIVESHFENGVPVERLVNREQAVLAEQIRTNRDAMLTGLNARDAAGALPEELDQTIRGYQESRVIVTAIELDTFTAVGDGASAAVVAGRCGTDLRATGMLLDALASMGLLAKKHGSYSVTSVSKRFFTAEGENDARAAMMHQSSLWTRWATLTECVRSGTAVRQFGADSGDGEWTRAFIAAMHRNASLRAPVVVRTLGAGGLSRMLDVGGGSGAYSIAFAQANSNLHSVLLDLETVLPITRAHIEKAGLSGRVSLRAGDLMRDDLGHGFDLVFVSAICHMLDVEENMSLMARCHAALVPGGRLVVQDFILEPDGIAPKSAALFSLNMLVGTKRGRNYTENEYRNWMVAAGLQNIERVRIPGPANLMIGSRAR